VEYNLTILDETIPVTADIKKENTISVSVHDKSFNVGYSRISDNLIHLTINGRRINAYIADTREGKEIFINGCSYFISDADTLEQAGAKKAGGAKASEDITPPMPAVVVSIMVNEGNPVEKGQGVIVVSAMKMETTLYAPYNGIVEKVNVTIGDKVMPGEILIDIRKNEEKTDG
jgi:3-methylcrotonyl-CoA carboxylase alpha subunit